MSIRGQVQIFVKPSSLIISIVPYLPGTIVPRLANADDYTIIGEVKSRDVKKFSKDEAVEFEKKFAEVKMAEKIERAVGFIFSRSGFTAEADAYCQERGIACSEDERWLETGK
jgi:hypothetical protein